MRSSCAWLATAVFVAACVNPPPPAAPYPPAADRFERAADPDPVARVRSAEQLGNDPSARATQMLLVLQQRDIDPRVRVAANDALGRRLDPSLEPALRGAAAHDPDPAVRAAAETARHRVWAWRKRPGTAAALSALCPGCGQLYLGDTTGYANLAATAALVGGGLALVAGHDISLEGPVDSPKVPIGLGLATLGQNLWFYSIFDAYRDARVLRDDAGYRHAITRESLAELTTASFRPDVLASPWVWAGVPIALGAAIGVSYLLSSDGLADGPTIFDLDDLNVFGHRFSPGAAFAIGEGYYAGLFTGVGVGEEALFRGVIQTELEERFGTWGGLAASSAIFGAVHAFNYLDDPKQIAIAVPVIAVLGSSMGLAYIHTGHKLSTSVAMHFWYDFLLSTIAFAADPTHQPFVVQYGATL